MVGAAFCDRIELKPAVIFGLSSKSLLNQMEGRLPSV